MKPHQPLHLALSALLTLAAAAAQAQDIKFANIVEMSGPGTTSGVMFKNGVELAIKEINAAGGIMGRKISYTSEDTQSNPGVAKGLTQKAVDNDVFAIYGPVFSGSIMGSIVTGFGLGLIEGLTKVFYPEASATVIFVIMTIVLPIKPAGLFGTQK